MSTLPNPLLAAAVPPLSTSIAMPGAAPSMGSPVLPSVSLAPPPPTQTQTDIAEYNRQKNTGSGVSQIQNPLLRGIARAADIAGSVFAPNLAQFIPGTTLHHQLGMNQAAQNVATDQAEEQATAQTANEAATTAHTNAATAHTQAETTGLPTEQADRHSVSQAQIGNLESETNARETPKPKSPEQAAYDAAFAQTGDAMKAFTAVKQASNTKDATLQQQFLDGYRKAHPGASDTDAIAATIRATSTEPKITVMNAAAADRAAAKNVGLDTSDPAMQASVNAVANGSMKLQDVFGRGATTAQKAQFAAAVKQVNPNYNSGDHDIENAVRRDFTSGTDSNSLTAINRAREHMGVFIQTAKDLDNGNVQSLNKLGNAFSTEFGSDKATNLNIAKQAFSAEVGKAFAGASVAEGDRTELQKSISTASSFGQLAGAARTADSLLAGAQKVLKQKYDQGLRGNPNFGGGDSGGGSAAPKEGDTKANSHGDKVKFSGGKWGPA